jgi:heterotetrameric sarcosine oxidase gamma subunit
VAELAHRTLREELGAGAPVLRAPGLIVRLLAPASCLLVDTDRSLEPGKALGEDPVWLWQAPGRALVVGFADRVTVSGHATDIADGVAVIALAGGAVPDILAQGCTLDARVLSPGRCARTLFAGVAVTLHATEADLHLYADRSLAAWLLAWLDRAAASLG